MAVFVADADFVLHQGDCLEVLREMPSESVHCCVTSPPYWGLRDYGHAGQLGLEQNPDEYVARMVDVFREVRRVLRVDGTLWLNLGDSYTSGGRSSYDHDPRPSRGERPAAGLTGGKTTVDMATIPRPGLPDGLKPKDLVGIPWRVAFALQADGWYLRSDIIWSKPNPMPESVTDRPTKAHEYVFLLTKSSRYYFDADAVREAFTYGDPRPMGNRNAAARNVTKLTGNMRPGLTGSSLNPAGRNVRSVWEIATQPYAEAHFATFPQELPRRCIAAGSPAGGTVLDPFIGSGTTAFVARVLGRRSIGIELNPDYCNLAARRLGQQSLLTEGAA